MIEMLTAMNPLVIVSFSIALLVAAVADAAGMGTGTDYYVGDWTSGANFTQWSQGRVFHVGDTLTFTVSPRDAILEVPQSVYDDCDWNFNLPRIIPFGNTTFNQTLLLWVEQSYYISSVQDNCRAGKKFMVRVETPPVYTPREYTVGDERGWDLGVDYSQWTANKNFYFGDSFRFLFNASQHSVVQVWEDGFQFCNQSYFFPVLPIDLPSFQSDGRTLFRVVPPVGRNYYTSATSANSSDCLSGLKLELEIRPQDEAFAPAAAPGGAPTPNSAVTGDDSSGATSIAFVSVAAVFVLPLLAIV